LSEKRGIRLGPVRIGIGKKKEAKKPTAIEIQGKLTYAMKRLEKKAQIAEAKAKQKRNLAKEALRQGREERARQRLISAQLQLAIAKQALKNADFAEARPSYRKHRPELRWLGRKWAQCWKR
jgi:hypothetical protein